MIEYRSVRDELDRLDELNKQRFCADCAGTRGPMLAVAARIRESGRERPSQLHALR
jgi:hypothetical protein